MKNLAILNLVMIGISFLAAFSQVDTTILGLLVLVSWGLSIATAIVALKK